MLAVTAVSMHQAEAKTKTYDLRYNLKPGTSLMNNANVDISMTIADTMKIDISMAMDIEMVIKARRDSLYDIDVMYKRLSTSINYLLGSIKMDTSDAKITDMMSSILRMMTGKYFSIVMTDKGRTNEIKGLNKLFDMEGQEAPAGIPENVYAQLKQQLKTAYGDDAFAKTIESNIAVFPRKDIAVGESWESAQTVDQQGINISMMSKYTLVKVTRKYYVVSIKANTFAPEDNSLLGEFKGTMTGEMLLDRKTAWPKLTKMVMLMKTEGEGKSPKINMTMSTTITDQ